LVLPGGIKPTQFGFRRPNSGSAAGAKFLAKSKTATGFEPVSRPSRRILSVRRNSLPINNSAKFVKDSLLAKVVAATYYNI
jgi:hypothetical protein